MTNDSDKLNILLVEDSLTQALLLQKFLEDHHMSVRIAKDGVEGLEKMKEQLPDIVISDIEMPRMDGYEFCKNVKADSNFRNVPIIILTNLSDPMDVIRGIECGCDSFLTKPCEINILLSTIHDAKENTKLHASDIAKKKVEFFFNGKRYNLQINPEQITGLLLSTYSNAIQKNLELERAYHKLNLIHEELQKINEQLQNLNEQKNQFLGMAAHDLRNPLSIISGYSDILISTLGNKVDEKAMKIINRIKSSSSMMLQLINDLLDISIIESGTVSLHLAPVDLPSLIQENLVFLTELAEKKNIHLKFSCPEAMPKINCDANKFTQILNNLVTNAIKFSTAGNSVEISLTSSGQEVVLIVKDFGTGLSPEARERLFQPFSKASSTGTAGEKGTGLGLAIVYKIVQAHQGKIWVESEIGKGSTFYIAFPLRTDSTQKYEDTETTKR